MLTYTQMSQSLIQALRSLEAQAIILLFDYLSSVEVDPGAKGHLRVDFPSDSSSFGFSFSWVASP